MSAALASLHIVRARARGLGQDRLRAQLAVQRLAAAVDAEAMLGPAAILVARRAELRLPARRRIEPKAAFEAVLGLLISLACRPAAGFVPADAEAVVFADEAELLACLAGALASGSLAAQWWWAALQLGEPRRRRVTEAWLGRPQAIAAALDVLDRSGEAAAFLREIGPEGAGALAQAQIAAHGLWRLSDVAPIRAPAALPAAAPTPQDLAPTALELWARLALHPATRALPAPLQWAALIAAAVRRASGLARSEAFAAAVRSWLAAPSQDAATPRAAPALELPELRASGRPAHRSEDPAPRSAPCPPTSRPAARRRKRQTSTVRAPHVVQAVCDAAGEPFVVAPPEPVADAPPVRPAAAPQPEAAPACEPLRTGVGGLLFLLNLALALGIFGDFTAPRRDSCAVSPWAWLAAAGERLCGRSLRADPLWALLRELAGEEQARAWEIPAQWRAERRTPIAGHAAFLRQRLCEAFGVRSFATVRRHLLSRPARVWITATRLDAVFDIATHPVQVRAAGLDRDPGWIPAAGRDVRFHFQ